MSSKIQYWCCVFDFSNVFFQMYHFSSILNKNFRISHSNTFVKILSILLRIDLFYLNKTADKAVLFHFTHKCIWSIQLCSIIENLLRWELSFESQCMKPIDHWVYQPSSLSTIEPIVHRAYQPSGLLSRLLSLSACWILSLTVLRSPNSNQVGEASICFKKKPRKLGDIIVVYNYYK